MSNSYVSLQDCHEPIQPPKKLIKWLETSKDINLDDNEAKNRFVKEYLNEKNARYLKNLKERRENIIEFASSLSIHGIPNFVRSTSNASKICWAIVTVISLAVSGYYMFSGIDNFLGYDVTTKIRFIDEQPTNFPSVTICNVNPFTTKYSLEFLNQSLTSNSLVLDGTAPLSTENLVYQSLDAVWYSAISSAMSPETIDSKKQQLGFTIDQFVLDCTFNKIKCNLTDFSWYYDFYRGNCFSFNVGKSSTGEAIDYKTIYRADRDHGLTLDLFTGVSTDIQTLSSMTGVNIKVHNYTMEPTTANVDGYDAPPGFETSFVINRLLRDQLPFPYSECLLDNRSPIQYDSILYTAMIASNYSYTQASCFDQCYLLMTIQACGCHDLVFRPVLVAAPCLSQTQIACTNEVWLQYTTSDVKGMCTKYCPLECNSITFSMTSSQLEYPSESYGSILLKDTVYMNKFFSAYQLSQTNSSLTLGDINYNILKNNIARVSVYYETSVYQYVSEFPSMDGTALLGNLGGTLGLFLGMSVISILEITEVLIEGAIYYYAAVVKKYL